MYIYLCWMHVQLYLQHGSLVVPIYPTLVVLQIKGCRKVLTIWEGYSCLQRRINQWDWKWCTHTLQDKYDIPQAGSAPPVFFLLDAQLIVCQSISAYDRNFPGEAQNCSTKLFPNMHEQSPSRSHPHMNRFNSTSSVC